MPILLDAIERVSICNVTDKPLHKWSSLLSSSMKDVFVITTKTVMSFTLCSQPALSTLLYLTLPQSSLLRKERSARVDGKEERGEPLTPRASLPSQERRLGTSQLLYIIFPRHGLFLFSLSSLSLTSYCPQFTFLIKTGRGRVVNFSQFSKEGGRGVSKKLCVN